MCGNSSNEHVFALPAPPAGPTPRQVRVTAFQWTMNDGTRDTRVDVWTTPAAGAPGVRAAFSIFVKTGENNHSDVFYDTQTVWLPYDGRNASVHVKYSVAQRSDTSGLALHVSGWR